MIDMNAAFTLRRKSQAYALLLVMIFTSLGAFILAATLTRTANISKLNDRERQYIVNMGAAEAATEKIVARMIKDWQRDGQAGLTSYQSAYQDMVPTAGDSSFWTNFAFSDAQGHNGKTFVGVVSNWNYVPLDSQYYGLWGYASKYRIISNVRNVDGAEQVAVAAQQEIQPAQIPIFQFAIFYNGLMEFTWAAPLTVRGRVHANGDIYTGSSQPLTFNSAVTATGNIIKKGWAGYALSSMTGAINYNSSKSTNVPTLSLPIGTNNTAPAIRELIRIPPAAESMYGALGTNRFYNKAEMVLLVSNTTVTAQIRQQGGFDTVPITVTWMATNAVQLASLPGFLNLTNTFTDLRENKTVKATQIDIGKYTLWASTNSWVTTQLATSGGTNNVPNIRYVADFRATTGSQLAAVRLTNGVALPGRGLTVTTPNPLYTWGNYNCPNSSHLNTTNTTQTQPAALISDAWTALSPSWRDSQSAGSLGSRAASHTTVNAALISGIVYSSTNSGSPFSGGAMNFPRLLEDWGNGTSTKLTLNTSIVNLYNSVYATNNWQTPGTYYYAPIRDFNFDQNFTDMTKLPPGTPMLSAMIRGRWSNPPPNSTTYAGY